MSCVAVTDVNGADVPLNATAVAPVKPEPVIVTLVPTGPLDGVKPPTVGGGGGGAVVTVKLDPLGARPAGVVTLIGPLVAPLGTVAVSWRGR